MYTLIKVWGYWNGSVLGNKKFCRRAAVPSRPLTADEHDRLVDNRDIFTVFIHGEPIIGNHGEFTITAKEVC